MLSDFLTLVFIPGRSFWAATVMHQFRSTARTDVARYVAHSLTAFSFEELAGKTFRIEGSQQHVRMLASYLHTATLST